MEYASFLAQLMSREFIFVPVSSTLLPGTHSPPPPPPPPLSLQPCEELSVVLQDVVDEFVNSEVLTIVKSGGHLGNKRLSYLDMDDEEDWEECHSDVEYQVPLIYTPAATLTPPLSLSS